MIKKIAIGILICSVLAAFIVTTVRIISKGSNRSEKPAAVINLSEILDNATVVGTYISNIEINAGESVSAVDLLSTAMGHPAEGTNDSIIVDLEHCSIFFDSGQTSELIKQPGRSVLTVIASSKRTDQNFIYYVELNAGAEIVTKITSTGITTSGSRTTFTTPPVQYYYNNNTPKKTQAPAVTSGKKYNVSGSGYSTNITGVYGTGGSLNAGSVPYASGHSTLATKSPEITNKPSVEPVTQAPLVTQAPSVTDPPATVPPADETQPPVHEPETDPPTDPDPEPQPQPDPDPVPEPDPTPAPDPDPVPQPEPSQDQPAE